MTNKKFGLRKKWIKEQCLGTPKIVIRKALQPSDTLVSSLKTYKYTSTAT